MSNIKTYLVSLRTLKEQYGFDDNIEDRYIIANIQKGQDFIIRPLLGETKWTEIINQINDNNVSTQNEELIKDYVEPCLVYYVRSEVLYDTAYKLKNSGLQDSDNANKFNELVKIAGKFKIDSDQYQSRLKNWMILYGGLVPDCRFTYKCGLYLGSNESINYNELP